MFQGDFRTGMSELSKESALSKIFLINTVNTLSSLASSVCSSQSVPILRKRKKEKGKKKTNVKIKLFHCNTKPLTLSVTEVPSLRCCLI